METIETIREKIQEIQRTKNELINGLRNDLVPLLAPLFDKHPNISSIGWAQFTPFFNDGDECVFRVDTDYPYVNGIDPYDMDEAAQAAVQPGLDEFMNILRDIDDEFMRELFGDHVKVTIIKDGVTTEDYEHD